jgi:5'-3' exoribonuclease 2
LLFQIHNLYRYNLVDLESIDMEFDLGEPFRPFEQLMGVLPAASAHALPPAFHPLMTDEDSPIIDFYPLDFGLDMNGKRFTWQAVVGLYKLNPVVTHSLKAPGFNP